ncbi:salt stress protein, Slr1339 family [Coleofasciculus sp. H7-2]|uniref:salt stress protein, Slr1339 family n=1 Tax=Coleofasciculus sp. H7-2 TaxID=3351545 RepID=UPI00366E787B
MESIDDILAAVKAEYETKDQPKELPKPPQLKEEPVKPQSANFLQNHSANIPLANSIPELPRQKWQNHTIASADDIILAQVRSEFEEQERAEQLKKQQQLREEQLKQEQLRQQQREVFKNQAQEWLKNLKPLSEEGLWFEEFADAYPSKLEAAIDYLQALGETKA